MSVSEKAPAFLVDTRDGVLTLTFSRPDRGNATPPHAVPQLAKLFTDARNDPSVRCILIAGRGKHFSTGGDVNRFSEDIAKGPALLESGFRERLQRVSELVAAVVAFDRPIIAAIRGGVAGAGLMYALAADIVIGDETAFFLFAHQRMGLSPDGGVTYLLPRVVGFREAGRLLLTAAKVDAAEAKAIGLLTRIVDADRLETEAAMMAARCAKAPQRAIRTAKTLLGSSGSLGLTDQLHAEADGIVECVLDPDFSEGVNAFIEKRVAFFPSTRDR